MNLRRIFLTLCVFICYIAINNWCINYVEAENSPFSQKERPTCILLSFSNDTKYKKIEVEIPLSDLILEKLMESDLFSIRETYPIISHIERKLYNTEIQFLEDVQKYVQKGDLGIFFESDIFNNRQANSISTAQKGQIIQPEIMRKIGKDNSVEYIIHGTVTKMSSDVTHDAYFLPFLGEVKTQKNGVGIECELRIIQADSGEVILCKKAMGMSTDASIGTKSMKFGTEGNSTKNFNMALESVSEKLINLLKEDKEMLYK